AETADLIGRAKRALFEARGKRPRPHLDNKILTSWNALMISALAKGYAVLGEAQYQQAALEAMSFLLASLYDEQSGKLRRTFSGGAGGVEGFLDDYAFLAQALLDVFEITFDPTYLKKAIELANLGLSRYEDSSGGGFFSTVDNAPDLLLRLKDDYDGAEPSGYSVATDVLVRLANLTEDQSFATRARRALQAAGPKLKSQPTAAPQLLVALGRSLAPPAHTVFRVAEIGTEVEKLILEEWKKFEPNHVTLAVDDNAAEQLPGVCPFLQGLERKSAITVYRCENFSCSLPQSIEASA
ncbi:MAG: thioredoxin domain-containing protein, partial [Acidobacteriota bacterium]|nr:thioredoxin domain-containing protein [Acidobacteriota bacterium]